MQPIISLDNVSKYYTSSNNVVVGLNSIRLSFHRGEFVAITGESGSGKSTLSNVIGGILGYESGEMLFAGGPTSHFDSNDWELFRRDNISYISQDYGILPGCSVLVNVITALRLAGVQKGAARERAKQILQELELWQLKGRRASKLSSGQKQRLSIARALAKPAPVLIADEPTGNLDPENSAKVISMLKKASESRLVLLVTHEFDEVKEHVTRHIRLQDGCVVVDAPLRAANVPQELPTIEKNSKSLMSLFVGRLQLRSRPIWTTLMCLLFTVTAFAVVAFMGTFIVALDDTNTRIYDPSAFRNGSPDRIIVSRPDLKPMDAKDYETIANVKYALQLERNGYVSDAQYAYRDGVDYTTRHKQSQYFAGGNVVTVTKTTYEVKSSAPFVKTVPVLPEGQTFLKEGRLPENIYEVVAHSGEGFQVGDTVTVFLVNYQYWSKSAYLKFDYTVVGLTDRGNGLYFHDDLGKFFQHTAHISGNAQYYQFLPAQDLSFMKEAHADIPAELMPENFLYELLSFECQVHENVYISKMDETDYRGILTIGVPNINLLREDKNPLLLGNLEYLRTPRVYYADVYDPYTGSYITREITLPKTHKTELFVNLLFVSQDTFDRLCWNEPSEQVSLTIEHYAYTQRVLDELTELGYVAASPYRLGAVTQDPLKAAQREQTLTICLLALLAVVLLQVVLLRALFGVQLGSYKLLRNIGLVRKSAKGSVFWQFLFFTLLGQLLAGLGIYLCWREQIERVVQILRYMLPIHLVSLCVLHLSAAMIAALWTVRSLEKQVYPVAGRFVDLQMDEEVAV